MSSFIMKLDIVFNFLYVCVSMFQPQHEWVGSNDINRFHGYCKVYVLHIYVVLGLAKLLIYLVFVRSLSSVRVANELGRGDAGAAKFAILMILVTSFSIALVVFVVFIVLRGELAYAFTTSEEVAGEVARLSPLLGYSLLLNGVQPILSGVAAGAGRQATVTYVNLASYYLIGIPLAVILGFILNLQVQVRNLLVVMIIII